MLSFSVITPSFNQGKFLKQSIDSVLAQNYPRIEHIIMDGGSTDETLSILRSFTHLQWQSQPDRGQSHALNLALARATGDIIAVMNADDWYPPGIFHEVAAVLEHQPLVMGRFELIDAQGMPMYQVANVERSWFDLMRYWVPYSTPPHPSIFVRRDALESVRLPDGSIIDEDFYYAMDYDLWIRLAARYPLQTRLDRVVFYYRMTEDNKTSHDIDGIPYAEPELSRIFRRGEQMMTGASRRVSVIIAVEDDGPMVATTIESALAQSVEDIEVVVVDYSGDRDTGRAIRRLLARINESQRLRRSDNYAFHVVSAVATPASAIKRGVLTASSAVVLLVEPGAVVASTAVSELFRIFSVDRVGVALPGGERSYQNFEVDPFRFVTAPRLPSAIAFRRIALLEFEGFPFETMVDLSLRWLVASLAHRGWSISAVNALRVSAPFQDVELVPHDSYISAQVLSDIADQIVSSPFGVHRANCGVGLRVTPEQVARSRELLARGGAEWYRDLVLMPTEMLTRRYPDFSPGWYRTALESEAAGDRTTANDAIVRFRKYREIELALIVPALPPE